MIRNTWAERILVECLLHCKGAHGKIYWHKKYLLSFYTFLLQTACMYLLWLWRCSLSSPAMLISSTLYVVYVVFWSGPWEIEILNRKAIYTEIL
jgi:hypothetical protein